MPESCEIYVKRHGSQEKAILRVGTTVVVNRSKKGLDPNWTCLAITTIGVVQADRLPY